jgi:hypothetical protein
MMPLSPKKLDPERSKQIAQQIAKQSKLIPKLIFENTHKAAFIVADSLYTQGFVVNLGKSSKPQEHSWLELDHFIIDLGLTKLNLDSRLYFPAQQLNLTELKAAIAEAEEDYPEDSPLPIYGSQPYDYYGELLLGGKDYTIAYNAAMARCSQKSE